MPEDRCRTANCNPVAPNINLTCEGVIDGDGLGHHFLMGRHRAFPLFE